MPTNVVHRKLIGLVLMPAVLASSLLGYFGYRDFQLLREDLIKEGTIAARHLAELAEFGLVTGNSAQLTAAALSIGAEGVRIYDAKEGLAAAVGQFGVATSIVVPDAGACGEWSHVIIFCAPVRISPLPIEHFTEFGGTAVNAPPLGRVEIAVSTSELDTRRTELIRGYAILLMLVMTLGLWLARRVERELARPIANLKNAVERLGHGDLSIQLLENGEGEIRTLQRGFNTMAMQIAGHHADQERRIVEATANLRNTLLQLEQRNQELEVEKHRAEAGSRAKSRFLAVMSHEIRTPLAGMIGMLSLLNRSELTPEQRSYVRDVERAAESLRLLIDDILDYSRIEAGKMAIFADPIQLRRIVNDVATMFQPSATDKGLALETQVADEVPDGVIGDALRLRQVLINLTANAVKFTERGQVRIAISHTGGTPDHPRLRFAVEDTGIGIPAAQRSRVFESFAQVDSGPTRRYGGSGLGTSIARELVHLMGGTIDFSSIETKGSCFWFELSLPLHVESTHPTPVHVAPQQSVDLPPLRILVAEDEDINARVIETLLTRMGHNVTRVRDGQEALDHLGREQFDTLILDLHMPHMDGPTAAKRWRKTEAARGGRLPIIALTANGSAEDRALCAAAGMDEFLVKPVAQDVLGQVLARVVRRTQGNITDHSKVSTTPS